MDGARIGIFDGDPVIQDLFARYLEEDGHRIVAQARNLFEAVNVIEKTNQLDIAIVESNYLPRNFDGTDGFFISKMLREKYGEIVVIIGTSDINSLEEVDIQVPKTDIWKLTSYVKELPARRQSA